MSFSDVIIETTTKKKVNGIQMKKKQKSTWVKLQVKLNITKVKVILLQSASQSTKLKVMKEKIPL